MRPPLGMIPLGFPGHQIGGVHRAAAGHEATHGLTFFFSGGPFFAKKVRGGCDHSYHGNENCGGCDQLAIWLYHVKNV